MANSIFSLEALEKAKEEEMNKYTVGIILGVLGAGLSLEASANQVLEQTPFVFEYNLAGPTEIESEIIVSSGVINNICVSYEFTGQVHLEASANGGVAYTKIVNGQPLVDGFVPGTQLRFKAIIGPQSSLKKVVIGYADSSGVKRLCRNPDLANYKNQKEIYISGGSEEVFNYPLKIELAPGSDVYFTAGDGQTPLYYYLDYGIASSPAAPRNDESSVIANPPKAGEAIYWVKVPQIPQAGAKIYMYYNDVIASPEGAKQSQTGIASSPAAPRNDNYKYNDPDKVFPFFDDFGGITLNAEKWEVAPGLKNSYSVKDGYLQLKDGLLLAQNFKIRQGILEFKAKAEESSGIQVVVRSAPSMSGGSAYEQIVYSSTYSGAEHTIAINNIAKLNVAKPIQPLTYYMYKATIDATGILFERYSQDEQEKQVELKFLDVGNSSESYIGLKAEAALFNPGSVYFDWVRVRPYIEIEPKVIVGDASRNVL